MYKLVKAVNIEGYHEFFLAGVANHCCHCNKLLYKADYLKAENDGWSIPDLYANSEWGRFSLLWKMDNTFTSICKDCYPWVYLYV